MFGKYLKEIRENNGYTQKELAAHLQLASNEFSNVDYVTISRWERGISKPSPSKSVRILRCFMQDITPYLESMPESEGFADVDSFLHGRFENEAQHHLLAALNLRQLPASEIRLSNDKLFEDPSDPLINQVKSFYTNFNREKDRLTPLDIDLYSYQEERKLVGNRIIHEGNTIAFGLAFFYKSDVIHEQTLNNNCNINLRLAAKYNQQSKFSIFLGGGNIFSRDIFICLWKARVDFLAKHSNITEIYINVTMPVVAEYLCSLGFSFVASKNQTKYGGIRIGNKQYERCIMKLDTSVFLTRKQVIALMRHKV